MTVIAKTYDVVDDNETFDELSSRLRDKKARRKVIDELPDAVRGFAAFMDQIGRRLRGERLKKRWFLHGYDDFDEVIQKAREEVMPAAEEVAGDQTEEAKEELAEDVEQ